MRDDQFDRIEALQERLVDQFTQEADPVNWCGQGKKPMQLTRDERGDQYWCKKNAAATLTLLHKTLSLAYFRDRLNKNLTPNPDDEDINNQVDLDKHIDDAEQKAQEIMDYIDRRRAAAKGKTLRH